MGIPARRGPSHKPPGHRLPWLSPRGVGLFQILGGLYRYPSGEMCLSVSRWVFVSRAAFTDSGRITGYPELVNERPSNFQMAE